VKLLAKPTTAMVPCGWTEPFFAPMTTCTEMEMAAIPGTNKVILSCASHATGSIAICDVGAATCGSPYSLSDVVPKYAHKTSVVACASSTLCTVGFFGSDALMVYLAIKNLDIESAVVDLEVPDVPSYYYAVVGLTAVDEDHFYLGASPVGGNTTRQADYPHDLNVTTSKDVVGVLISAVGGSWSAFSDPASTKCDYVIAGNELKDSDVCGSRPDCEAACAAMDACVAFDYVPRTYVCTLYSTCSPAPTAGGSVVVSKAASAKCKAAVAGALLPPALADSCAYDTDPFVMTSCALDGEYFQVSSTEYRTASNRSRIVADSAQPCLGWVLEANTAPAQLVKAFTYKSAPQGVVDAYAKGAFAAGLPTDWAGKKWQTSCMLLCPEPGMCPIDKDAAASEVPSAPHGMGGPPPSWNCTDAVVSVLCAEQCTPLVTAKVADVTVRYHEILPAFPPRDAAAEAFGGSDCETACGCTKKQKRKGLPCTTDPILGFLCPLTCQVEGPPPFSVQELEFLSADGDFTDVLRPRAAFHTFGVLSKSFPLPQRQRSRYSIRFDSIRSKKISQNM
jgi:hypothetical protein